MSYPLPVEPDDLLPEDEPCPHVDIWRYDRDGNWIGLKCNDCGEVIWVENEPDIMGLAKAKREG